MELRVQVFDIYIYTVIRVFAGTFYDGFSGDLLRGNGACNLNCVL